MSGPIRFKLGGFFNTGTDDENAISAFKFLWDHLKELENAGVVTEIARNNGDGSGVSDTNWPGESDQFQDDAWAVFRWNSNGSRSWEWYLHLHAAISYTAGVAVPALVQGSTSPDALALSVGVSVNTSSGATSNPWAGSTGSPGSDTKGSPVWTTGSVGDTLFVFPRSNNLSGTHVSLKQNSWEAVSNNDVTRMHVISDDDSIAIFCGRVAQNTDYAQYYGTLISPYTPNSVISSSVKTPLVVLNNESDNEGLFAPDATNGTVGGTSTRCGGGIIAGDQICTRDLKVDFPRMTFGFGLPTDAFGSEMLNYISGSTNGNGQYWNLFDAYLFVDSTESDYQGYCGMLNSPIAKVGRFMHNTYTSPDGSKAAWKSSMEFQSFSTNFAWVVTPWTSSVDFGRNYGRREGIVSGSGLTPLDTV